MWLWEHSRNWIDATCVQYVMSNQLSTFLDVSLDVFGWIRGARLDTLVQWRPRVEAFIKAVAYILHESSKKAVFAPYVWKKTFDVDIITAHMEAVRLGWPDGSVCIESGKVIAIPMPRNWSGPRACPLPVSGPSEWDRVA